MAERSKALRSGRSLVLQAWVRIPLLTITFRILFFAFFFNLPEVVLPSLQHFVSMLSCFVPSRDMLSSTSRSRRGRPAFFPCRRLPAVIHAHRHIDRSTH